MAKIRLLQSYWSARATWFGNEDDGALIDLKSGREIGHYMHDGYGKWDLWVCLTYWRAWRVIRSEPAGFTCLAAFPRCWVWLFRAKSQEDAMAVIERYLEAKPRDPNLLSDGRSKAAETEVC